MSMYQLNFNKVVSAGLEVIMFLDNNNSQDDKRKVKILDST